MEETRYGLKVTLPIPYDQAVDETTTALKAEGFGVLTTIDVRHTLKQKLDKDFRRYVILGACNPRFAYESLQEEDKVGVFLPCNVVVQEHENGEVEISIIDPEEMIRPTQNLNLQSFATGIKQSMLQVLRKIDG